MAVRDPAEWAERYESLSPIDVDLMHGGSTLIRDDRWGPYNHLTHPPLRVYEDARGEIGVQPYDRIIDLGCADGGHLLDLRRRYPYTELVGLDIDDRLFVVTETTVTHEGLQPITFQAGSAEMVDQPDDSFDIAIASYMLYEVPYPELVLAEMRRIVRPGGKIVVTTISPGNKPRHRKFESLVAERLHIHPPRVVSAPFNTNEATDRLRAANILVTEPIRRESDIVVTTSQDVDMYLRSIATMWTACHKPYPPPALWAEATEEVVRPIIEQEISTLGKFSDRALHAYFVGTNVKESV